MSKSLKTWPGYLLRLPVAKSKQPRQSYHVDKERWIESLVYNYNDFVKIFYIWEAIICFSDMWFYKVFAKLASWIK